MGAIRKLAIAVLLVSCVTFVALFGRLPAFRYVSLYIPSNLPLTSGRRGPVGVLHRLIWTKFPGYLRVLDSHFTGGRFGPFLSRSGHYLMDENHPLVLVGFISIKKAYGMSDVQ